MSGGCEGRPEGARQERVHGGLLVPEHQSKKEGHRAAESTKKCERKWGDRGRGGDARSRSRHADVRPALAAGRLPGALRRGKFSSGQRRRVRLGGLRPDGGSQHAAWLAVGGKWNAPQ